MQIKQHLPSSVTYTLDYPITLEELFAEILMTSQINRRDCLGLKLALLQDDLSEDHHAIISRILYSLRRGNLRVID